jgi:hypothetical protein
MTAGSFESEVQQPPGVVWATHWPTPGTTTAGSTGLHVLLYPTVRRNLAGRSLYAINNVNVETGNNPATNSKMAWDTNDKGVLVMQGTFPEKERDSLAGTS